MLANHAEIGAGTFFGRVTALLEIDYLGIERVIAITQRLVQSPLLGNCLAQIHRFSVATIGKPELCLQAKSGYAE